MIVTRMSPFPALLLAGAALLVAPPLLAQDEGTSDQTGSADTGTTDQGGEQPADHRVGPDQPYTPPPTADEEEEGEGEVAPGGYDPQGRRDPFRPLVGPGQLQAEVAEKCEGELRCIALQDVRLTSIVKTPQGNLCLLEGGPRKEGFFAKEGDRLKNGYVYKIDADRLVVTIREELEDKRLLKPYRDYQWSLYREEEAAKTARPLGD